MDHDVVSRSVPKVHMARRGGVRGAILVGLLVLLCSPTSLTIASDPDQLEAHMGLLFGWRDPAEGGRHLRLDVSTDGSRLLLVGYGSPNEVRVTNRTMATLATLTLPGPSFAVKGAVWSQTEHLIAVWGRRAGEGNDSLLAYDAATYAASEALGPGAVLDLVEISAVCLFADDVILAVAGRDVNGTSILAVIETPNQFELRHHLYPDNATVVHIGNDGRSLVCTDLGGGLTTYRSTDWTQDQRFEPLSNGTTAQSIREDSPWVVGDGSGRVVTFGSHPPEPVYDVTVGEGPVQGVALVTVWPLLVAATPGQGGGSRIDAWLLGVADDLSKKAFKLTGVGTDTSVTLLSPDPVKKEWVWAAFEDGSISVYEVSARLPPSLPPEPPVKEITKDEVVTPGLELLRTWHTPAEGGRGTRFEFSSDGFRLALVNYGAPGEVRVVDRYLRDPRNLPLPDGVCADATLWSATDRWLAVHLEAPTEYPEEVLFYDSSSLKRVEGWDLNATFGLTFPSAGRFLSGDRVLAVSGVVDPWGARLLFIDLDDFSLIASHDLTSKDILLMVQGEDLVCLTQTGVALVFSGPGWTAARHAGNLTAPTYRMDFSESQGWLMGEQEGMCHAFMGTGWGERVDFNTSAFGLDQVIWTGDVPGDLVTAGKDEANGSYIKAWRLRGGTPNSTGPEVLAETHTASMLISMRSDPSSPGTFMASFQDGTLRLYHVAVPGARSAPDVGDDETSGARGYYVVIGLVACLVGLLALWARDMRGRGGPMPAGGQS